MTEYINLQKSSGIFEISPENWAKCVLEKYLGNYMNVKSTCPSGNRMHLWITALAIKILELKMGDKKELWDLVVKRAKNS